LFRAVADLFHQLSLRAEVQKTTRREDGACKLARGLEATIAVQRRQRAAPIMNA